MIEDILFAIHKRRLGFKRADREVPLLTVVLNRDGFDAVRAHVEPCKYVDMHPCRPPTIAGYTYYVDPKQSERFRIVER